MKIIASFVLSMLTLSVSVAMALEASNRPCAADRGKFCKDIAPGPELVTCLTEHKAELSPACKGALENRGASSKQSGGPCKDDRAKLCAGVKPGAGAVATCLKAHEAELSAACKEHLSNTQARAGRTRGGCKEDIAKLCKDIAPGGGRIADCLRAHESELSAACKTALAHR